MIHKLSDKVKIILAVMTVVVVAAGAVTVAALSSNANGVQNGVYADGNAGQGVSQLADVGVTITSDNGATWSTDKDNPTVIGEYDKFSDDGLFWAEQNIVSTIASASSIDNIAVRGLTFEGNKIEGISQYGSTIDLTQAGIYTATVTINGVNVNLYAKINKKQLSPYITDGSKDGKEYTETMYSGEEKQFTVLACHPQTFDLCDVIDTYSLENAIKGFDCNADEITQDIEFLGDDYTALYSVTNAGRYEVSLTILESARSNYEWTDNPDSATNKAVFTVNQAVVSGSINKLALPSEYSSGLTIEDVLDNIKFTPIADSDHNNNQTNKYKLQFKLFADPDYKTEITELAVGQDIYAKAVAVLPYSDGSTVYLNYRLPEQGEAEFGKITADFTLQSPPLRSLTVTANYYNERPDLIGFPVVENAPVTVTGTNISATYLNFGYKISQWFYGAEDIWIKSLENGGHEYGKYWVVTVDGENVDPNEYVMKDVGTYNINVKPKEGYRFDNVSEYNFTFTIGQFTLDLKHIDWIDNENVYTGNPIPFGEKDYKLNLPKPLDVDNDKLTLSFEQIDGNNNVVTNDPVRAGSYFYKVSKINGENASNYKLSEYVSVTNKNKPYKIYKKELPAYSGTSIAEFAFNGQYQQIVMDEYFLSKKLGEYRENNDEHVKFFFPFITKSPSDAIVRNLSGKTFSDDATLANEIALQQFCFSFTYAGSYDVTFIMDLAYAQNHCWYGESKEPTTNTVLTHYVWKNFIKVTQAEVDPSFAPTNISTKDDDINIAQLIAEKFNGIGLGEKPAYSLSFGKVGQTATSATPLDKDKDGAYAEGDYYVLVTLNDDFYPSCIFKTPSNGEYTISDDGKTARINYVVSSSTVDIKCTVNNYIFGDNFASDFGISNVITVNIGNTQGADYGEIQYEFLNEQSEKLSDSELVNGLPRNAGKYYVVVSVDYTLNDGETNISDTWSRRYELNVAKRQVSIEWLLNGGSVDTSANVVYNGNPYTVTVNVSVPNGLPSTSAVLDSTDATNADTYIFTVTGLNGEEDNYALDGVTNLSFVLTVSPMAISVTANSVSNIEFGQALVLTDNAYAMDGSFVNGFANLLSVAVYSNGSLVSKDTYGNLNMGAYVVVPVWGDAPSAMPTLTDGQYVITLDNYNITVTTTKFNVNPQTLHITFRTDCSYVYGETIDLWDVNNGIIASVRTGSTDITIEQLKNIATITATLGSVTITANKDGVTVDGAVRAGVGKYALAVTTDGGNYGVDVTNPDVNFTVTPREVTIKTNDVLNHRFGSGYNPSYSGYTITSSDGFLQEDKPNITINYLVYQFDNEHLTQGYAQSFAIGDGYLHFAIVGGSIGSVSKNSDGEYYYTKTVDNYKITSVAGKFVVVPRALTVTFKNGSSVYGSAINLWAQRNSVYTYFTVTGLRANPADNLKDVVDVCLVDGSGVEFDPAADKIGAGTYKIKLKVKSGASYVILDGDNDVTELAGGQFAVSPKSITLTTTTSVNSVYYGDGLVGVTLDFTVDGLVSGDTKDGLNISVAIYDGDNKIANVADQNVGNYVVGVDVSNLNSNYVIANNGVTKASFAITKRTVTLTFTSSGASSEYGEAVTVDDLYGAAVGAIANLANGHKYKDVVTLSASNGNAGITAENAPASVYTVTATLNGDHSANYTLNIVGTGKYTITPRKVTLKPDDVNHGYKDDYDAASPNYSIVLGSFVTEADKLAMQIVAVVTNSEGQDVTDSIKTQPAGDYTISLKVTNVNSNYDVDVSTTAKFVIAARKALIQFKSDLGSIYGNSVSLNDIRKNIRDNVLFTITGLLDGDENNVDVSIVKIGDDGVSALDNIYAPVGDYVIIVTLSDNYEVEYSNWAYESNHGGAYAIAPRPVKLVADNVTHTYGNAFEGSFGYTAEVGDGLYDVLENDVIEVVAKVYDGTSEISDFTTLNVKTGGYVIKLAEGATKNANYAVSCGNGTFTVIQREITLTYVPAAVQPGSAGVRHTTYNDSVENVSNVLYSAKLCIVNGLVNNASIKDVLKLDAKNANGVSVLTERAPAGEYTIEPTVINGNYVLASGQQIGVYVIGKANLVADINNGTIIMGDIGYTGEPQSVCTKPIVYSSVDGTEVTVLYKVVSEKPSGTVDEGFFDNGATNVMPTITNVSNNYVYICAKADNHNTMIIGGEFNIVPAVITVTAKAVEIIYGSEFAADKVWYDYNVTSTVTDYQGLSSAVLQQYLNKLTYNTNYTKQTAANASGITITPVYDNGSSGDNNVTVKCVANSVTVNKADITNVSVSAGYNGVYTGQARDLFKDMSATTVDNCQVKWEYRKVGESAWITYADQKGTNVADSGVYEIRVTADNHNEVILDGSKAVNFVITKNSITIKADDKEIIYGEELSTVTFTSKVVYADGQTELIPAVAQAYIDKLTSANYTVNYTAVVTEVGIVDITVSCNSDDNVDISFGKGILTVKERSLTLTFVSNAKDVYGVSNVDLFDVMISGVTGLAQGHGLNDVITLTATDEQNAAMAQNLPHAGRYTVKASLVNRNYKLEGAVTSEFNIAKRVITVENTTPEMTFKPLENTADYIAAAGGYGQSHSAALKFANTVSNLQTSDYTVTYSTADGSAPVKAGNYDVKVALVNGNYTFEQDGNEIKEVTLSFAVTKIELQASDLVWHETMKVLQDGENVETLSNNYIPHYDSVLMNVVEMFKITAQNVNTNMPLGDSNTANTYYFNSDRQLCITSQGRARYVARFKLSETALLNYAINGADEDGVVETICVIVDKEVVVKITTTNWQYGDKPIVPVVTVNGQKPIYGLTYEYARLTVNASQLQDFLYEKQQDGFKGFELSAFNGMYDSLSSELPQFDVGFYMVCVTYDGLKADSTSDDNISIVTVTICDIIEVEKKQLNIPLTLDSSVYNGAGQWKDVEWNITVGENEIDINELLNVVGNATDNSIYGVNVGTYEATVTIKDTSRYVWADAMNAVDGVVTVTWDILIDDKTNDDNRYFEVSAIATVVYGNDVVRPKLSLNSNIKDSGYGESFTWYFASKQGFASAKDENIVWKQWTKDVKPTNAGDYFAKVVLSDTANGGKNFTDKIAYGSFTISKATLTLTPNGTMVYGNIPKQENCSYTVSGLIDADKGNEKEIIRNVSEHATITYVLVDDSGNGLNESYKNKLVVGTYNLIVRTNSDKTVYGLQADNYVIVMINGYGKFEVTPRHIKVEIGNASGQFGLEPNLANVTATYVVGDGEVKVDEEIILKGVKDHLATYATAVKDCGKYGIYSTYNTEQNKNFVIEYTDGEYEVTPREVYVTLNDGNGAFKGEFNAVTIASVLDSDSNVFANVRDNGTYYVITVADSVYTVTVVYNGTSNNGTTFNNSVDYPQLAGNFTATVVGSGSGNFVIVGEVSAQFTVEKFTVDKNNITAQTQMYAGKPIEPTIVDDTYESGIYVVKGHEDFVNADDYNVTLVLTDYANYMWADSGSEETVIVFTIAKAGIYAIPYGMAVYGDSQTAFKYGYKLVYADDLTRDASADVEVNDELVKFIFVNKNLNLDRLVVDEYDITLEVVNGFVVGMASKNPNYGNIALQLGDDHEIVYGTFKVTQRQITIKPVATQSVYSQTIKEPTEFDLINGTSLAPFDKKSDLNYSATVNADNTSNQGTYVITPGASNANYEISFENGAHTIVPISVEVTLTKQDGVYDGQQAQVIVSGLAASNYESYQFASDFRSKLIYSYNGTQFDGNVYKGSAMPNNAGNYVATVDSVRDERGNFVLKEKVGIEFVIAKKTINENEITIESKIYNGLQQSHGLTDTTEYTVSAETFKNAGGHNVTLTLTNTNNYEWSDHKQDAAMTKTFVISKARLTLTPYGTITYGDSFESGMRKYGFTLDGLVGDDVGLDSEDVLKGKANYLLENGVDGTKLNANLDGYTLIVDDSGLTSDNYDIKTADGKLIVSKLAIKIVPVSSHSVYGKPVVLSNDFDLVNCSLAVGDDKSVIDYKSATYANETSDAGYYDITAEASNANYDITVLTGTHTIVAAKVGVRIRAINGTYGGNIVSIEFVTTVVINSDGTTEPVNHLKFTVKYDGKAYDGTEYDGYVVPDKAGVYTATVTSVVSKNYELDASYGISCAMAEVFKREINADMITAQSAAYTGGIIVPTILDTLYNIDGEVVYTVSGGLYSSVGTHDVTLTLIDTYNCEWKDNLNSTAIIKFEITKANNGLIDVNDPQKPSSEVKVIISGWTFDGEASKPQASVASGDTNIVFEYAASENGAYTIEVPKNAGEYWVRATVAATDNYNAFVSAPTKFVISKKTVQLPVVTNPDGNSVYTGSMLSLSINGFDDQIMSLTLDDGMYRSDSDGQLNLLALNANTYTAAFRLRNSDNYVWSDETKLVDGAVVVNWTVERQVIKRLPNADSKILVNGEDIVFTPEGFNSGIMTIEGNVRAHEGNYTAVVTLKDTANYVWEDTDSPSITVNFELTGTNTAFIAAICVVSGLCVGLGAMALILTLVYRRKKRKESEAIDARSRADGWEGE